MSRPRPRRRPGRGGCRSRPRRPSSRRASRCTAGGGGAGGSAPAGRSFPPADPGGRGVTTGSWLSSEEITRGLRPAGKSEPFRSILRDSTHTIPSGGDAHGSTDADRQRLLARDVERRRLRHQPGRRLHEADVEGGDRRRAQPLRRQRAGAPASLRREAVEQPAVPAAGDDHRVRPTRPDAGPGGGGGRQRGLRRAALRAAATGRYAAGRYAAAAATAAADPACAAQGLRRPEGRDPRHQDGLHRTRLQRRFPAAPGSGAGGGHPDHRPDPGDGGALLRRSQKPREPGSYGHPVSDQPPGSGDGLSTAQRRSDRFGHPRRLPRRSPADRGGRGRHLLRLGVGLAVAATVEPQELTPLYVNKTPSGITIEFFSDPRHYTVDGVTVPSVTEILDALFKDLSWWGQETGVRGIEELWRKGLLNRAHPSGELAIMHPTENVWTLATFDLLIEQLKLQKLTTSYVVGRASDRGQAAHDALEAWAVTREIPSAENYPPDQQAYIRAVRSFCEHCDEVFLADAKIGR